MTTYNQQDSPAQENDHDKENDFNESDITLEELALLNATEEDDELALGITLDDVDDEGVPLEEKSTARDFSGEDLDVPGSEDDDEEEIIGGEDEENNSYSQSDTE